MSERQKKKLAQREALKIKRRMIEKVRHSNVAFNLNLLVDGWLELESDPGTFSLLIEDFGCSGAQVDEIYDLEQKFDGPVLGFIFLFKWINNNQNDRSRNQKFNNSTITNNNNSTNNNNDISNSNGQPSPNKSNWTYVEDESIISDMFFAKQMISNSCATHALISILLNCDFHNLKLGPTLSRLKEHTKIMDPENKGYAIGNLPELAKAHNSHASYSSLYNSNKPSSHSSSGMSYMISGNQRTNLQQQNKHEAYHFVSYVPIKNRLYELDGLKNYPIDHGPIDPKEGWTEKFRAVIKERILSNKTSEDPAMSNEIRYNLMAVTPDKRVSIRSKIRKLKQTHRVINESVQRLTKRVFSPISVDVDIPNPPYSPLSNGTLTASETGSVTNSPRRFEEDFYPEDDNNVEKLFFVKFTQQEEPTIFKEENLEPAHKNCIIDYESTSLLPINLKIEESLKNETHQTKEEKEGGEEKTETEDDDSKSSKVTPMITSPIKLPRNRRGNNTEDKKIIELAKVVYKKETQEATKEENKEEQVRDEERTKDDITCEAKPHNLETSEETASQLNGLIENNGLNNGINEVQAHNNEKYNLSSKPPFDFNILDEMQHVHFDKSTLKDMKVLSIRQACEISRIESSLKEEIDKRRKYKIDNSRRTHNYEPFIMTFLSMLAKQGNLADLIEKDLGLISEEQHQQQTRPSTTHLPILPSSSSTYNKTPKPSANNTPTHSNNDKLSTINGSGINRNNQVATKINTTPKPKYKYVSTGRPVGRPRKNPLPTESPVKTANNKSTK